jgi:hypothetical protein
MRRIPTMMASAGAAALTTLAVAVAVPAIGDDGSGPQTADALAACLRANGLDGAPDGAALKPWLGPLLDKGDATALRALKTCNPQKPGDVHPSPSEQQLRSCLKDHGAEVPGDDPAALKRWILEHQDDAATVAALKACDGPVIKSGPGACDKPGPGTEAGPRKPADTPSADKAPDVSGAATAST